SSTSCAAVGFYRNSAGVQVTLAERWNGTSWTIQSTPNPTGAKSIALNGVSCTNRSPCTPTGRHPNSAHVLPTLAARQNGTSCTLQRPPTPTHATPSVLDAVSCTASSACAAVGQYRNSAGVLATLAERWNGTSWTIQSTPNPTGAKSSALNAVSC